MMTKSGPQNRKELCLQREFSAVDTAKWAPESWHNFRNWAMKQGDVSVTERRKPRGAGSEVCLEPEVVTLQLRAGWGALDLQFHRVESLHLWLCWSVQFSSVQSLSRVRLFVTPWIAARWASLSSPTIPPLLSPFLSLPEVSPRSCPLPPAALPSTSSNLCLLGTPAHTTTKIT